MGDVEKLTLLNLLEIGTKVDLGFDGQTVQAIIISINIVGTNNRVSYEVAWWSGATRNAAWVSPFEIASKTESNQLQIGFQH